MPLDFNADEAAEQERARHLPIRLTPRDETGRDIPPAVVDVKLIGGPLDGRTVCWGLSRTLIVPGSEGCYDLDEERATASWVE